MKRQNKKQPAAVCLSDGQFGLNIYLTYTALATFNRKGTTARPADSLPFFKTWHIALQKVAFRNAKDRLLQCKRRSFRSQKVSSWFPVGYKRLYLRRQKGSQQ